MGTILLYFSLTVKVATLIFISGRGSAGKGNQGLFIIITLNSHLLTLKAHNHKMYVFVVH